MVEILQESVVYSNKEVDTFKWNLIESDFCLNVTELIAFLLTKCDITSL